jgi:uncharacterized membrane protein
MAVFHLEGRNHKVKIMNQKRPKLRVRPQKEDKLLEIAGWIVILGTWLLVVLSYAGLPNKIPAYYDFGGDVAAWGGKVRIFILPTLSTLLLLIITYFNFHPHLLNYPVNIDAKNAFKHYFVAVRFNRYVKLLIALIFFIVTLRTIEMAHGHLGKIGFWSIPIILIIFVFPMATLLIYLFNKDRLDKEVQ